MARPSTPAEHIAGRVVLVTGATDGIGRQTALQLGRMGARVLVHGRDPDRGGELVEELKALGVRGAAFFRADFSSLVDVVKLAGALKEYRAPQRVPPAYRGLEHPNALIGAIKRLLD